MPLAKKTNPLLRVLQEEGIGEIYLKRAHSQSLETMTAPPSPWSADPSLDPQEALEKLKSVVLPCVKCLELASTRKKVVFGSGNVKAELMFVGEAPGADEDEQGLPFVGRAGQLLTKIIESIGITRDQVFIANVLKCRPPGNRQPKPDEIANCSPYLKAQIEIIRPKVIVALGTFAAQTLLQTTSPITRLRGKFYDQGGYKLICTYHPAYLLYSPGEKRAVWEDMKMIKKELEKIS